MQPALTQHNVLVDATALVADGSLCTPPCPTPSGRTLGDCRFQFLPQQSSGTDAPLCESCYGDELLLGPDQVSGHPSQAAVPSPSPQLASLPHDRHQSSFCSSLPKSLRNGRRESCRDQAWCSQHGQPQKPTPRDTPSTLPHPQ